VTGESTSAADGVTALLRRHLGLDADSLGEEHVVKTVERRADQRGFALDAYVDRLKTDARELAEVVEEVIVPETWFFRDAAPFEMVARRASKQRMDRPGAPFRVLSVPCSTGEEPYSIAMALSDVGFRSHELSIDAADVSSRAIAFARAGVYGKSSFRGLDPDRLVHHLKRKGDGWELQEDLRRAVRFEQRNVLDASFLRDGRTYEAIFCRNLLIYLTREARQTVIDRLIGALAQGGVIVSGAAELLHAIDPRLRPLAQRGVFAYERDDGAGAGAKAARTPTRPPVARKPTIPSMVPPPPTPPPSGSSPSPSPIPPPDLATQARSLADRGHLNEAATICDKILAANPADVGAHYLLGVVRAAQRDDAAAEICFTRTLYLDPRHVEALVQLALILDRRGDAAAAEQLRRRARRGRSGERA
jgi:chemotaxis protein methyltransferase WspC